MAPEAAARTLRPGGTEPSRQVTATVNVRVGRGGGNTNGRFSSIAAPVATGTRVAVARFAPPNHAGA